MKLCFATHNENKLKEIRQLVPEGIAVVSLNELGQLDEIPETGETLVENSELKARFVLEKFSIPVFADDSGLEIDALEGRPGVYSARYAGLQKNSDDNMDKVLSEMKDESDRSARFKSVITFLDPAGRKEIFEGAVEGTIINEKRGHGGFGYDPIFIPEGHDRTFAQMTDDEKNSMSHRARALAKFLKFLEVE